MDNKVKAKTNLFVRMILFKAELVQAGSAGKLSDQVVYLFAIDQLLHVVDQHFVDERVVEKVIFGQRLKVWRNHENRSGLVVRPMIERNRRFEFVDQ